MIGASRHGPATRCRRRSLHLVGSRLRWLRRRALLRSDALLRGRRALLWRGALLRDNTLLRFLALLLRRGALLWDSALLWDGALLRLRALLWSLTLHRLRPLGGRLLLLRRLLTHLCGCRSARLRRGALRSALLRIRVAASLLRNQRRRESNDGRERC